MESTEPDVELGGMMPSLVPLDEQGTTPSSSSASSSVHTDGSFVDHSSAQNNITFRPIQPGDQETVQSLHEEWFPVIYQEEFYRDLCENERFGGEPLFTCVATVANGAATNTSNTPTRDESTPPTMNNGDTFEPQQPPEQQQQEEEIVACVVGSFVNWTRLSAETQALLVPDRRRHGRLFYIMTLGTVVPYRHLGLGTCMVQKCMEQVESDPSCGALYLHVITFNQAAIRFYERLGFYRVQEIQNYYAIDGKWYNCYLYAKYYHGNRGHRTLFTLFSNALSMLWKQLKSPLALLLEYSDEHDDS